MVCSRAFGASAVSVPLMRRELSSYMIIATRRPWSRPNMCSASKLPKWAPQASTPWPAAKGCMMDSTPLASTSNSSKHSRSR